MISEKTKDSFQIALFFAIFSSIGLFISSSILDSSINRETSGGIQFGFQYHPINNGNTLQFNFLAPLVGFVIVFIPIFLVSLLCYQNEGKVLSVRKHE